MPSELIGPAVYIATGIICGFLASDVASKKGYSYRAWFACGFFFGIFGLIAAAGLPVNPRRPESTKRCPNCGELIDTQALICRYCGQRFSKFTLGALPSDQ